MDNNDIHNHLQAKEVRDFLAKQYQRTSREVGDGDIAWIEKQIARLQEELIHTKEYLAVKELLKVQGWTVFDVSDDVPYNRDTYFGFVGTQAEYDEFINNLVHKDR